MGSAMARHFTKAGNELVVISRQAAAEVQWDGETLGPWADEIDGSDLVVNLAGRSVNCRYTATNLREMLESRVKSTRVIGEAIGRASRPPRVWLQASTATIYAHRFDVANDEHTGILGGNEPGAPRAWNASIAIAKAWEAELEKAETPRTRKVAMRSAMTMSPDKGSVFDVLRNLARRGLGSRLGRGDQYVSWIHERDFCRALDFIVEDETLEGAVNICSPFPLPQADFMAELRRALGVPFGLAAPSWLVEVGTWLMRTESELVLKSRRVVPTRLLEAGFRFDLPRWSDAVKALVSP